MSPTDALARRVSRAWATLEQHPTLLIGLEHPDPDYARQGRSFRQYVVFLLRCGGRVGRTRACKFIEEAKRRREEPKLKLPTEEKRA